jgi:hypothetical protein
MRQGLAAELRDILKRAAELEEEAGGEEALRELGRERVYPEGDCGESGVPCWHLQEAAQFVAEDIAESMGLDSEVLSVALTEAMKCDSACGEKYRTPKGDFKGGKGEAFKTCEEYARQCCSGVKDPTAFCAYLGRRAGKI